MYAAVAAGVAIPALLILYFLKLRRRDVEISTTLLWKKAIQDLQANAPFQKLRRNILLILQLLALAAILTAIGQPQIKSQSLSGKRHVILIDRSASMLAKDEEGPDGPATRLDAAKKKAAALVDSMREGGLFDTEKDSADQAMLILFDTQSEIRQPFTSDKAALKRAIDSIQPTEGPTSIEEALRLANAQRPKRIVADATSGESMAVEGLLGGPPVTFHIYSDGRIPDIGKASPGPEDSVEFHRLGLPEAANLAVTGLRSERSFENPSRLSVYVSLQNNTPQARSVDVELLVNGTGAGIKTTTIPPASREGVTLSPGEAARAAAAEKAAAEAGGATPGSAASAKQAVPGTSGVVFSLDRGEGAIVQVRIRNPGTGEAVQGDVLDIDDRAWLVVPPAKKLAVGVVSTKGNLFLTTALEGLPLSRLVNLTPAQFQQRAKDATLGEFDVIVLDGWLPRGALANAVAPAPAVEPGASPGAPVPPSLPAPPAEDLLPPGRYLIFGVVPLRLGERPTGIRPAGAEAGAGIVDWQHNHPVLRSLSLDGLLVAKCPRLEVEPGSPALPIATSDIGPIMFDVATAETRALVVPFDVAESNWPFNVGFVVFSAGAMTYLGEDGGSGMQARAIQPGSVVADRVPYGASSIRLKRPGGETEELTANEGNIVFGPVTRTGVYEVSWDGPGGPTDIKNGDRSVRTYAANLLDSAESDLAAADRVELASKEASAKAGSSGVSDKRLWPWLLLACLAVVMLEWFVYNKKVHV